MAYQSGLRRQALYTDHVRKAADFLVARGPRSATSAGRSRAATRRRRSRPRSPGSSPRGIAAMQRDDDRAKLYLATADHFQRSIKGWTVTTTGPYAPGRYFIRLSRTGDPNAAIVYNLGNGSPDADQRAVIDQGFLELTRLGALPANDPDVKESLQVVDQVIRRRARRLLPLRHDHARHRGRLRRLPRPRPDRLRAEGKPWPGRPTTTARATLARAVRRTRRAAAADRRHRRRRRLLFDAMGDFLGRRADARAELGERPVPASPFGSDPATASIGFFTDEAAGSATPLTWAQAQHVRLALSLDAGRPLEQPAAVRDRYRNRRRAADGHRPADGSTVADATTHVTGTTAPGAPRRRRGHQHRHRRADRGRGHHRPSTGAFDVTVPTAFGTSVITTTATTDATAYDQRRVASDVIDGTTVFDTADPAGDDNGPGTFHTRPAATSTPAPSTSAASR